MSYATYKLDTASGDLVTPLTIIRGSDAIMQRIRIRFKWFLGEWFLDQRQGVPYFTEVLIKNPDPILISTIFRQVLKTTPGVKRVLSFSASLDRATRVLTVVWSALLDDNTTIKNAETFIIGA